VPSPKGAKPEEIGDFRRIDKDFCRTVDKNDLCDGKRLVFFECVNKVARVSTSTSAAKA
jgi:hypothetical protein